MNFRCGWTLAALSLQVFAADPRVQPGATFYIELPGFGRMAQGGDGSVGVYIPTDYAPDRKVPLFTWFGGGDGGNSPEALRQITGGTRFVCVGLPYKTPPGGGQGGWAATSWADYRRMMDLVEKAVPNIDPQNRISGGFSSGGAAVTKMIAESEGGYQDYFYAFMPGGSGVTSENAKSLKGRPMLFFMGDQDMRYGGFRSLFERYVAAGVNAEFLVFKGVGHDMPGAYFPQMREWALNKVLRRNLGETAKAMQAAAATKSWTQARSLAGEIRSIADPASAEYAEAGRVQSNAVTAAKSDMDRLVRSGAPPARLREFARAWRAEEFSRPLVERCNAQGEQDLAALAALKPAPYAKLEAFLAEYEGFAVHAKAAQKYGEVGEEILTQLLAQPSVTPEKLKAFAKMWDGFPASEKARAAFSPMAAKALEQFRRTPNPDAKRMTEFIAIWSPSASANEVKAEFEAKAQQELVNIQSVPQATMRNGRLGMLIQTYRGTAAAEEAAKLIKKPGKS
jgi:hypothetical protein